MSDFQYVCNYYGVPACYGRGVVVDGRPGIITAPRGAHIGVTFDDAKATSVSVCHPTWRVEYGEIRQPRKLTRSQRRYADYVRSECDLSFREWLEYRKQSTTPAISEGEKQ